MKVPFLVLSALFVAESAHAATSPFDGTWKLDVSKSRYTGDTFTYSKTTTGYHASAGGAFEYDFAIDGKPHHVFADRTTTWSKADDGGWDILIKAEGKLLSKEHTVLSPDGAKLSTNRVSYRPDGTTASTSDVYARVCGVRTSSLSRSSVTGALASATTQTLFVMLRSGDSRVSKHAERSCVSKHA